MNEATGTRKRDARYFLIPEPRTLNPEPSARV